MGKESGSVMEILHIIVGLRVGGAELMLKRLIESHQDEPNYRHSVISLTDLGMVGSQLRDIGVDVQTLEMGSLLGIPRVVCQLSRLIRASEYSVVQTWMYHADFLGGLAARLAGNRNVIWGVRTTDVSAGGKYATTVVRNLCAVLSRWIPHTIVCAAEASRRAHADVGYDASRMVVVPNGFDVVRLSATSDQRSQLRRACGFSDEMVVVGTLGRFNVAKDHHNFVHAAGLVAQRHPRVRFLMIGRDLDADNKELASWIARTGYADRFVLLGERGDVPICLSAMDVFCLSSRTEGFPNVVGEAMAMGIPCVVTDVGDAAMLVANTGIVVPRENSEALAHAVGKLVAKPPSERQALGQRARDRIHAEFTIKRASERFSAIYDQIVISDKKR
jgi:glycosyltransferase involved in cell wall biosynthesis